MGYDDFLVSKVSWLLNIKFLLCSLLIYSLLLMVKLKTKNTFLFFEKCPWKKSTAKFGKKVKWLCQKIILRTQMVNSTQNYEVLDRETRVSNL